MEGGSIRIKVSAFSAVPGLERTGPLAGKFVNIVDCRNPRVNTTCRETWETIKGFSIFPEWLVFMVNSPVVLWPLMAQASNAGWFVAAYVSGGRNLRWQEWMSKADKIIVDCTGVTYARLNKFCGDYVERVRPDNYRMRSQLSFVFKPQVKDDLRGVAEMHKRFPTVPLYIVANCGSIKPKDFIEYEILANTHIFID